MTTESAEGRRYFRAVFAAIELAEMLGDAPARILDVGGGPGVHARFFRSLGHEVDVVDIHDGGDGQVFVGDFLDFIPSRRYDAVWSSHVLEHVLNPGLFVKQMIQCCREGGLVAVTVPPQKNDMTFGHVTAWVPGLLPIFLVKSGVDCRELRLLTYSYNISAITPLKFIADTDYYRYLPPAIAVKDGYFPGDIAEIGWKNKAIPQSLRLHYEGGRTAEAIRGHFRAGGASGFVMCFDPVLGKERFHWWDAVKKELVIVS